MCSEKVQEQPTTDICQMSVLFFQERDFREKIQEQFAQRTDMKIQEDVNFIKRTGTNFIKISVRKIQERLKKEHIKFSSRTLLCQRNPGVIMKKNTYIFPVRTFWETKTEQNYFFPGSICIKHMHLSRSPNFLIEQIFFPGAKIFSYNRCTFPGTKSQNNRWFFPALGTLLNSYFVFSSRWGCSCIYRQVA